MLGSDPPLSLPRKGSLFMTELSPKTEKGKLATEVQALQQEAIHFAAT